MFASEFGAEFRGRRSRRYERLRDVAESIVRTLSIIPMTVPVGVVNTNSNEANSDDTVGNNPVALAVTPDKSKLYVANNSCV